MGPRLRFHIVWVEGVFLLLLSSLFSYREDVCARCVAMKVER